MLHRNNLLKVVVIGVVVGILALASGVNSVAAEQPIRITAVLKTLANPFWVAMASGLLEEAINQGVVVEILAVPTEEDLEHQLNLCETSVLRKPDVMLVSPITSRNLLPCLREVVRLGIPIVDLDGNLPLDFAKGTVLGEEDIPIKSQIASNNIQAGEIAADYMIQQIGTTGKVLVIEGLSGNITGMQRAEGFINRIKAKAPGIQVIGPFAGDWDRLKAATITADVLTAHPDLRGIYCANDTMALGAVEAVIAAGKGGQVVVIGTDGIKDARDAIMEGRLSATVAQLPYFMGAMAVETAVKIMRGEAVPLRQDVPLLLLTKQVLEAGVDPLLKYIK